MRHVPSSLSGSSRLLGHDPQGPRFFDAITVDAWCLQGPFLRVVEKLGGPWVVVFKQERREADHEALQLSPGQKPVLKPPSEMADQGFPTCSASPPA